MTNENVTIQFKNAIRKALQNFNQRLEQQKLFQIQNILLKKLHEEVKRAEYCRSQKIIDLSSEYEDFYGKLKGSGRSYEHIVDEKNLVDTYSAFEKFLFDCFCALYTFFPKHLDKQGKGVNISISDLFIDEDIELCKKNIVEREVKNFIQSNNIKETINGFNKIFKIEMKDSGDEINILYEISLVRNLIIHNHSMVNRIHIEQVKKFLKTAKYSFKEGDIVLNKLPDMIEDIKLVSTRICEKIADAIIQESTRLEKYHEQLSP